jgi:Cu/Ag efflux pump CusA
MTSLAFILGVAPLAVATGAGAEMRQSLGTAVLFGMVGVTCFGLLFTPTFYTVVRRLGYADRGDRVFKADAHPVSSSPARREPTLST